MVPPVEIAPKTEEKSTEKLTDTRSLLLRLGDSMKAQENPVEKKKVVRSTLQTLTKEQLAMAEAELTKGLADAKVEGADVPAIFKNPEEVTLLREGIAEETRARLAQASKEVESTLSPETKKQMQAVGWGLGIGAILVASAVAWKATRNTAGKVLEAASKKASSAWEKVRFALGVSLAVGLSYVGIRVGQKYMELRNLKNQLDVAKKAASKLGGKAKEEADAHIRELEQTIASFWKKDAQSPRGEKQTPIEKVKEKGKALAEDPTLQATAEETKTIAIVKGMLLFDPPQKTWGNMDKGTQSVHIHDTINDNGNMLMSEVLASTRPTFKIIEGAGEIESRRQASLYLWNFCRKHKKTAEEYVPKDGKPLTLNTFLKKVAETYAAALHIDEKYRAARGDVFAAINNFDGKELFLTSSTLSNEAKEYLEQSMRDSGFSEEEISQLNWKELLRIFTSLEVSIAGSTTEDDGSTISKVKQRLQEKLKDRNSTDVHKYMLPFFHRILPQETWDEKDREKNEEKVHGYLVNHMSMDTALRCTFYTHLIKKGNPTGLVLMQAEILKFIASKETSIFSFEKQTVMTRIAETLSEVGTDKLSDEWETLNLDPTMIEKGLGVLKSAFQEGGKEALKAAAKGVWEGGKFIPAVAADHPILTGTAGAVVLAGIGAYEQAGLDSTKFIDALGDASKRKGYNNLWRSKALADKRRVAVTALKEIEKILLQEGGEAGIKILDTFVRSGRRMKDLKTLESSAVALTGGSFELTAHLGNLQKSLGLVQRFRLPVRMLSAPIRVAGAPLRAAATVGRFGKGLQLLTRGRAVPVAGAAIEEFLYKFYEKEDLQKQFNAETDPLKREVIRNEMFSKEKGYQASYLLALAYGMSPVGFGLWLANQARQNANESIVEGTKYMLQDRRDLAGKSAGTILGEIQKSSPGSMVTYGQWLSSTRLAGLSEGALTEVIGGKTGDSLSGTNLQNMDKTFEAGNTSARSEAYAAYFKNGAALPPVSAAMLKPEEAKDPQRSTKRLALLAQEQTNNFVQSALSYIARTTKNTYAMVSPELLHRAELYAYECHVDWVAHMMGEEGSFTNLGWDEKEDLITESIEGEKDDQITQIQENLNAGESRSTVLPFFFITNMKEELALCEAEILKTNYSDWGIPFYNSSTHEEMQNIARTMFGEKLRDSLVNICKSTKPITRESFEADRQSLLAVLKTNPDTLAIEGFNRSDQKKMIDTGTAMGSLSMETMLGYLEMNQLPGSAPQQKAEEKEKQQTSPDAATKALANRRVTEIQKKLAAGESRATVLPFFLTNTLQEELAASEANIVKTNYSDWGWKVWDMSNHTEMQNIARVMLGEKFREALGEIGKRTNPITKESLETDRQSLVKILALDPDKLALEGFNNSNRAAIIEKAKGMGPLSMEGMLRYLENPLALSEKPKTTNVATKAKAKSNVPPPSSDTKINAPTQAA